MMVNYKSKIIPYDILKSVLPVLDLIEKYHLNTTDKPIHENGVAYQNSKCKNVLKYVRKVSNKKNDHKSININNQKFSKQQTAEWVFLRNIEIFIIKNWNFINIYRRVTVNLKIIIIGSD